MVSILWHQTFVWMHLYYWDNHIGPLEQIEQKLTMLLCMMSKESEKSDDTPHRSGIYFEWHLKPTEKLKHHIELK